MCKDHMTIGFDITLHHVIYSLGKEGTGSRWREVSSRSYCKLSAIGGPHQLQTQ